MPVSAVGVTLQSVSPRVTLRAFCLAVGAGVSAAAAALARQDQAAAR
jgi:hypothetical protein